MGVNSESSELKEIFQVVIKSPDLIESSLRDVNLFPTKLNDLHGRDITLAIFNYLPYTLWMDVVSNNTILKL